MSAKILVLEDDEFIREGLSELLTKEGYTIKTVQNIAGAVKEIKENTYSLLMFDNMLPDGTGIDLCRKLREEGNSTPILFLTACDDELQIVNGLDSGADDYITKPFRVRELFSRIKALLRRTSNSVYSTGGISLDLSNMTVNKDGELILLTPTEFQILASLIKNIGVIVTRSVLLQNIWDDNGSFIDDNTLSVHISRLREKIGAEHIITIRGVGYRWEE